MAITDKDVPNAEQASWCCAPLGTEVLTDGEAGHVAGLLKVLADPIRLRIVSIVANAPDGQVCACDLPGVLGRSQPTVSHHLTQLTEAGVLSREKRGKWAWFSLNRDRLTQLCAVLAS